MADEIDGNCLPVIDAEASGIHESCHSPNSKGGDSGFESGGFSRDSNQSAPSQIQSRHSMDYIREDSAEMTPLSDRPCRSMVHSSFSSGSVTHNDPPIHSQSTLPVSVEASHRHPRLENVSDFPHGRDEVDSFQSNTDSVVNVMSNPKGVQVAPVIDNSSNVPSTSLFTSGFTSRRRRRQRKKRKPVYGRPLYPNYASYRARLNSFRNWKYHHIVLPEDLAAAGLFYLDVEDKVKCFVSGCGLCNWEKAYSPDKEHKGWFPECRYARLRDENPASLVEFDDSHAVRATLDFGYTKGIVGKAYDIMRDKGVEGPNASELLDVIFELQKHGDPGYSSGEDIYGASSDESEVSDVEHSQNLSLEREVDITRAHFNRAEANRLKEELSRLEKVMKCHSCGQQQSNMVNLPCGHLATCDTCVYKSSRCGRCNTLIRGVVRVYMV